jgi:hypothetical protein
MSITGMTLVTDIEDRCLDAELRHSTTSKATRRGMGKVMQSKAIMTLAANTHCPDIGAAAVGTGRT